MKKLSVIILAVLFIFALSLPAFAADEYDDSFYRFTDKTGFFDKEEVKQINATIDKMIPELEIDLPIFAFLGEDFDADFEVVAETYYEHNGFGYGKDKSAVMLVMDLGEANEYDILYYGSASDLIDEDEAEVLSDLFSDNPTGGYLNERINLYLKNVAYAVKGDLTEPVYSLDVIDNADIFTDEEEAELAKKVRQISKEYDVSYVVFTDVNNHGSSPEYYSADFLYNRGYGKNSRGAVVFYISMDSDDRCCCTTRINWLEDKFTDEICEDINDHMRSDMKSGNYYSAALTHISYVDKVLSGKYRAPINWGAILISLAVGAIIGLIVGGMHIASCKKGMRVVAPVGAREYLLKDSFVLRNKDAMYLYSTVTKTPKQTSSSSSGGSSHTHGSSSGGSFSSSRMSF